MGSARLVDVRTVIDPGQHVWCHVAVEHQPQCSLPSELSHGEKKKAGLCASLSVLFDF